MASRYSDKEDFHPDDDFDTKTKRNTTPQDRKQAKAKPHKKPTPVQPKPVTDTRRREVAPQQTFALRQQQLLETKGNDTVRPLPRRTPWTTIGVTRIVHPVKYFSQYKPTSSLYHLLYGTQCTPDRYPLLYTTIPSAPEPIIRFIAGYAEGDPREQAFADYCSLRGMKQHETQHNTYCLLINNITFMITYDVEKHLLTLRVANGKALIYSQTVQVGFEHIDDMYGDNDPDNSPNDGTYYLYVTENGKPGMRNLDGSYVEFNLKTDVLSSLITKRIPDLIHPDQVKSVIVVYGEIVRHVKNGDLQFITGSYGMNKML